MNTFEPYFSLGWHHILDIHALDHLLFMGALLAVFEFTHWKRILILLTAFTLGHGLAMLIALTQLFRITNAWVEFLIPLTILITSIHHLIQGAKGDRLMYAMTLLFGIVHGLAYSQGFVDLFANSDGYVMAALGFNIGVEVGQLAFALIFLVLMEILSRIRGLDRKSIRLFLYGIIITLSLQLLIENWIF